MMAEENSQVALILKKARADMGISQPELARRIGTTQQTINKIESGLVKRSSFLPAIAVELGVSLDRVLRINKSGGVAAIAGQKLVGERDLPVYAVTQGGNGVSAVLAAEPVEYVLRPEPLARVRDGYGVIVSDDTMAPEVRADDIALVNPNILPRIGDTCVFRSTDGGGVRLCIKHLRKVTDELWHVSEWNADGGSRRDFTLKRSSWTVAHVTIGYFKRR